MAGWSGLHSVEAVEYWLAGAACIVSNQLTIGWLEVVCVSVSNQLYSGCWGPGGLHSVEPVDYWLVGGGKRQRVESVV